MNAMQKLLTEYIDSWTAADTEKKAGRGRSSANAASVYGIRKLRELIFELAVRGKLVQQDTKDEPASELLKRIQAEKAKLIAEGKIKKDKSSPPITEEEKPFELPHGWDWIRLNELLRKIGAGSTPLGGKQVYVTDGVPFLRSQNVWDEGLRLDDVAFISSETHQKMSGTHVFAGDLLFNITGASIGRCAIVPDSFETGNVSQHVTIVRSVSKEILQFLHLVLISKHVQQTVMDVQVGVSREGLSIGKLGQFIIPIPPIDEQHRIVAKVDELMALCDQLETQHNNATEAHEKIVNHLLGTLTQSQSAADFSANWQRIAAHFDILFTTESSIEALKQTLLQLAVMGKLVPQDPKDEPASELFKRIQAEKAKQISEGKIKKDKLLPPISDKEKPFALPMGWKWVRLSDITSIRGGSTPSMAKSEYWGGKIPWVSPKDMHDGIIVDSELKITDKALKESNLELVPVGSILIVGRSGILKRKLPAQITAVPCTVNQDIKAVTPIKPLSDRYMQLIFWGNEKEILVRDVKQGTTVQSLVYENLFSRPFSLPPAAEQNRIIAKVDELMVLCEQLKSRITDSNQLQQKLADVLVEQAVA